MPLGAIVQFYEHLNFINLHMVQKQHWDKHDRQLQKGGDSTMGKKNKFVSVDA